MRRAPSTSTRNLLSSADGESQASEGSGAGGGAQQTRLQEQALLAHLANRYGTDTASQQRRPPQARGSNAVVERTFYDDALMAADASGTAAAPLVSGGPLLSQLFLAHLDIIGDAAAKQQQAASLSSPVTPDGAGAFAAVAQRSPAAYAADALREELRAVGADDSYSEAARSALNFRGAATAAASFGGGGGVGDAGGDSGGGAALTTALSPLALLLCPMAATREACQRLRARSRHKVLSQVFAAGACGDVAVNTMVAMIHAPMWLDPDAAALHLYRNPETQRVRAATLNQLVEELTRVRWAPHLTRPERSVREETAFAAAFFRTHRYFTTSHALLAKLFERFFVPAHIAFGDRYDQHGIYLHSGGAGGGGSAAGSDGGGGVPEYASASSGGRAVTQRTAAWLLVARLVQTKVLAVLAVWLRGYPQHFDDEMLAAIGVFLDEATATPPAWADCAAPLLLAAEFVREAAAVAATPFVGPSGRGGPFDASLPPTLRGTASHGGGGFGEHDRRTLSLDVDTAAAFASGDPATAGSGGDALLAADNSATRDAARHRSLLALLATGSGGGDVPASHPSSLNASVLTAAGGGLPPPAAMASTISVATASGSAAAVLATAASDASVARLRAFAQVAMQPLARRLTRLDHEQLRAVAADELLGLAVAGSVVGATANVATGGAATASRSGDFAALRSMLARGEDLMLWAATTVLLAGAADVALHRKASAATAAPNSASGNNGGVKYELLEGVVSAVVSLAFRLMDFNNLHSAFAVVCGLQHPAVARLRRDVFQSAFAKPAVLSGLDRLLAIFDFGATANGGGAEFRRYAAAIPDDDVYPVVPVLHVFVEDIRRLHTAEPSLLRAPVIVAPGPCEAPVSENPTGDATAGHTLVHWRKFYVIAQILGVFEAAQAAPVPADLPADPSFRHWLAEQFASSIADARELTALSNAILPF